LRTPRATEGIAQRAKPPRSRKYASSISRPRAKNPCSGLLENAAMPASSRPKAENENVRFEFIVPL